MSYNQNSGIELKKFEWMLKTPKKHRQEPEDQYYGDLTELNTDRSILDTVGRETLKKIAEDTIDLLETSVAIYEKNGDYAMGIFASGWCRKMDSTSRKLCGSLSNKEALESGKWICHECCWDFSKRALESGEIVDESCEGGINLYAIPIISENQTIGVLSVGYGNPPEDEKTLRELSEKYGISVEELRKNAQEYNRRPKYIEEIAKKRMCTSTELIALMYQNKKDEEALIKAKEEAQAANKAKSDFLASMSHEIRTPINGVIGFSELLKSTPLSASQKEYNDIVVYSAKSLLGIINDILDFSKIEAGKLELCLEKTNLYEMIDSALSILNYQAIEKNIELVQSVSRNVPKFIYTDPIRLRQILLNLLSNAVKFTDEGEVELMIRKRNKDTRKKRVRLHFCVRDTGIGIQEEHVHKISEPFNQGNNMITHKYGGTGLGLAITKSLLEKMGSHLTIESTVGKGSTFSFELELRYEAATPNPNDPVNEEKETENVIDSKANGKKVMIVEDNRINMQYLETVLRTENKNLTIINAYDGETGLELFKKEQPDLILMDIQLPKMNGYEVTGQIRKIDKEVPIIAITARAFKGEREKCMEAGMTDYLPKPVSMSAIKKILSKYQ